jgi:hypothetical protein
MIEDKIKPIIEAKIQKSFVGLLPKNWINNIGFNLIASEVAHDIAEIVAKEKSNWTVEKLLKENAELKTKLEETETSRQYYIKGREGMRVQLEEIKYFKPDEVEALVNKHFFSFVGNIPAFVEEICNLALQINSK